MQGLRETIHGNQAAAAEQLRRLCDIPDPEGRFYVGRPLAYVGELDQGIAAPGKRRRRWFFCLPALTRDPWLDPLRARSEFTEIVRRAESRHRQAVISFLNAEGDRVLGVAHPV